MKITRNLKQIFIIILWKPGHVTAKMALPMNPSIPSGFIEYSSMSSQASVEVASTERLKAYSDAIFSIIATVMILPVTHREIDESEDLRDVLVEMAPVLTIYFVSFFVVTNIWGSHTWLFETVEKTDDVLVILNLALVMASTFLPYTYTLLGFNPAEPLALILACLAALLIYLLQCLFIFHVFRTPAILHQDIRHSPDASVRRSLMYVSCLVPAVLCVLPLLALPVSPAVSWLLLTAMFLSSAARKLSVILYRACKRGSVRLAEDASPEPGASLYARAIRPQFLTLLEEKIPKERVIAYSDGVFAIVATIVILDICEGAVPGKDEVRKLGGLAAALAECSPLFRAYAGTFITVATLWTVHHTLLQYVVELNKVMVLLNTLCLSCIGLLPFGFKWSSMYTAHKFHLNELVSIHLNLSIIFLAGLFQAAIWVVGLCNPASHVHASGTFGGSRHVSVTCRLAVYPVVTLVLYFLTFASFEMSSEAFQWMEIGMPVLFIIIYLIFKHSKKCCRSPLPVPSDDQPWPQPVNTDQYDGD